MPNNTIDLCQPADSFIIQKIKTVWRRIWDEKRFKMIESDKWVDWRDGSGMLTNPGKRFYLQLAAAVIKDVDRDRDRNGVLYSRKSMMCYGMALNLNGRWEVQQLLPHFQQIVSKYRENFDGKTVGDSLELDGAATESDRESLIGE